MYTTLHDCFSPCQERGGAAHLSIDFGREGGGGGVETIVYLLLLCFHEGSWRLGLY